jgi:hypothetical protein
MERRGFLKGLFGGVTSAGLIVTATPQEIEAFASPLKKHAPLVLDQPSVSVTGSGEHIYNSRGEVVGIITEVTVMRNHLEVTSDRDTNEWIYPTLLRFDIKARGIGRVELGQHGSLELRGGGAGGGRR